MSINPYRGQKLFSITKSSGFITKWYMLGKTLEVAWKFSQESRIHMVAINPGLVISPLLQPTLNASVKPVLNIVKGVNIPCETYRWVDVRDVASAHIRAFENPISLNILNFQDKQKRKLPPQTTSLKERNFINA
ncbi:hypothetical protein ACOSP7_018933 [Xanthoceras sorbifolium]